MMTTLIFLALKESDGLGTEMYRCFMVGYGTWLGLDGSVAEWVNNMQPRISLASLSDGSERSAMVEIPNVDDKAASMVVVRPTILQMIDSEEIQTTIDLKFDKKLQETKERPVGERALRKRRKDSAHPIHDSSYKLTGGSRRK